MHHQNFTSAEPQRPVRCVTWTNIGELKFKRFKKIRPSVQPYVAAKKANVMV